MVDMKSMSSKEKIGYVWDYYKIHIIGGAVLIFVLISIIYGQITKIENIFNLTLMGPTINDEKILDLEKDITSILISSAEKKKQASIGLLQVSSQIGNMNNDFDAQLMQKFMAQVSVGEIDLLVLDKNNFDKFVEQKTFSNLEEITELSQAAFKNKKLLGDSSASGVYGIDAENNKKLENIGYDTKNKVICIVVTSKRKDKAVEIMKWLLIE